MLKRSLIWIAWTGILLTAIYLRINNLGERPIHADEATGARILAQRLEAASYTFDPTHFHGPIQSIFTEPITRMRGETSWDTLNIHTLRLGPVIAGILLVMTPLLWVRWFGVWPMTFASALIATSPLLIYYNRMFIHESWLVLFGMLAAPTIFYLLKTPHNRAAATAACFVGLMFATKETFAISILSWSAAGVLTVFVMKFQDTSNYLTQAKAYAKPLITGIIVSILVSALFYSNYFRNPSGILDAFRTFFVYETTPGHEKPAFYYFNLLIWPKFALGNLWTEGLIGLLAILGCVRAIKYRTSDPASFFLALSFFVHWLVYSLIAYKTPWLMLLPWAHAILLAGYAIAPRNTSSQRSLNMALCVALFVIAFQLQQSIQTTRFENDSRNPYAYVPTSKDPQRIQDWIQKLAPIDTNSLEPTAVVGSGYWPLPWYLRDIETIGYWTTPNEDMTAFPLVFAMPSEADNVDRILQETHNKLPRALRSNVPVFMYLRNDLWNAWMKSPEP